MNALCTEKSKDNKEETLSKTHSPHKTPEPAQVSAEQDKIAQGCAKQPPLCKCIKS